MNRRARLYHLWALASIVSLLVAMVPFGPLSVDKAAARPGSVTPTDVFLSEYVEGSSNNKALEIFNGTGASVDLAAGGYQIEMYFNGSSTAGATIALTGVVASGEAYVLAHSSAVAAIIDQSDQVAGGGWFNGNDAIVLRSSSGVVDSIGQIGTDPGEWGTGDTSTANNTLRRQADVCAGDTNPDDVFDPAAEWVGFAQDTFDGLGVHSADCEAGAPTPTPEPTTEPTPEPADPPAVSISEIRIDQPGSDDDDEYFELAGASGTALDGLTYLVIGDGSGGSGVIENVTDLTGSSIGGSGFFVAAESSFTLGSADLTTTLSFENSDNVTHLLVWQFTGANGDDLDTNDDGTLDVEPWDQVVDSIALVEEENPPSSTEYHYGPPSVGPDGSFVPGHVYLCEDGWRIGAFDPAGGDDTPGAANACAAAEAPDVTISEIRIDQPGGDDDEYFELAGTSGTSLDGLTYLVIGDGSAGSGVIENVTDLTGFTISGSGFFVAAETSFTLGVADLTTTLNFENSDNVTHLLVMGFSGSNGDDLDTNDDGTLDVEPWDQVVDSIALVEEENPPSGTEYHYGPPSVGPDGSFVPGHVYRCDDGWHIGDFGGGDDTPGATNPCDDEEPPTLSLKIHEIQGSGLTSPVVGSTVLVEGIVVGDFQDGDSGSDPDLADLNGFFVQEEDADADGNDLTSEGIFVFDGTSPSVDVQVGDLVQVQGAVSEFNGLTEITSFSGVTVVSSGNPLPTAATPSLPVAALDDFEAYEGMLVTFSQALTISEFFNYDRFGEIVLTSDRQFQPTALFDPGSTAAANEALANELSRITLDDGRTDENPDPALHPNGMVFDLDNRFRGGDTVHGVTGVMHYAFGLYRIQPTAGATYSVENPRPETPPDVGGNLQVAAFNVLNYFTTIDNGQDNCGPSANLECRGADNQNELDRQRAKIVAALAAMDADVVGLIEIQNDEDQSVADLVQGLNDALGAGTYDYIETGFIGTDAIKQAFIYRPGSVTPIGDHAVLDTPAFVDPNNLGDAKNRPALAQTFMDNETGGTFTAVVNHFKSKGSPCGAGDDDPVQGNCNLTRTLAAEELIDWLATDPTGSGDSDVMIIGDLNAYDHEDPIDVLRDAGYTDLLLQYQGENAYTYVFDGQLGYLDYALSSSTLTDQISGADAWHINTDEPDILDYDTSFKQDAQDALYEPNPFRSSDHDPVLAGMDLVCSDFTAPVLELSVTPDSLWPANHMYVEVSATVAASDNLDPNPTITLLSVTSNEPDDANGNGDGSTVDDIVIVDDTTFQLRAERAAAGDGRVYTITYQVTDACGNFTIGEATVTVPHNQGEGEDQGRGRGG